MIAIKNAELILHDHFLPDAVLFIEDGKIAGFGEMRTTPIPAGCRVIDAEGLYLGAGFVDIHTHAGLGVGFENDAALAAANHLKRGTTSLMPAIYPRMSVDAMLDQAEHIRALMHGSKPSNLIGIYMEGPYLNVKFGSHKDQYEWNGRVEERAYRRLVDGVKDITRVWMVAPERENIEQYVRDIKKDCPNAVFAVGHSEASPQQIEALMPYGLRLGTHHTNSTGDLPKYPECRGVCVDEAVNYNREIYAELICDSCGIHVDPYMQRLVRRIKGDDRLILITDATMAYAPIPKGYEGVTDLNFDHLGDIAGSNLTLNVACRNMMKHTGASLVDVFNFAAYNPARVLGLTDRGEIAVGKRADLVIVDHKVNVKAVFLGGEEQEREE